MSSSLARTVTVLALVAAAGSTVLSRAVPRQMGWDATALMANTKAEAETCRDRLEREVPLGATQCILHDVYVCTPNQVWKKTDKHC